MNYFLSLKFPTRSLLETQTAGFERAVLLGNQISTASRLDAQLGRFAQFQIISFRRVTVGTDAIRVGLPVLTVLTCSQMNKKKRSIKSTLQRILQERMVPLKKTKPLGPRST